MLQEREVVTLGFGNYGTLVAAQWANGTSHYDMHHHTLYCERRLERVYGGSVHDGDADGGGGGGGGVTRVRVPRLLVLDAPHASYAVPLRTTNNNNNDNNKANRQHDGATTRQRHCDPHRDDDEDDDVDALVAHTRRCWLRDGYATLAPDGDDDDDNDSGATQQSQQHDDNNDDDASSLFVLRDTTVPWWRYITTGLDVDSITTLRPLHARDAAGDVPALHSVGYGLSRLSSTTSADVAQLTDALRRHVEDCDRLQGLQCFVDGDTLFAGVAHNVLHEARDDLVGAQVPMVAFTAFLPLPPALQQRRQAHASSTADDDNNDNDDVTAFAQRRRDEAALNRLLATSTLSSHRSLLYVPLDLCHWHDAFAHDDSNGADALSPSLSWLHDDTATAQYLAAVADTALYGLRDGVMTSNSNNSNNSNSSSSPAYYMHEWCSAVRPMPSLRVAAMNGVLPLSLHAHDSSSGGGATTTTTTTRAQDDLQSLLQRVPLLPHDDGTATASPQRHDGFVALSHALPRSASSEASRVVGHAVTLRGAGVLPCTRHGSGSGSADEAMLQYAQRLRTSSYLPLLTRTNYPISRTFPHSLLRSSSSTSDRRSVDVGAHVMTTYASATMLRRVVRDAQAVLQRRMHVYSDVYDMHKDDWREYCEDVLQMYDDYHHERNDDDKEDDEDDDDIDC